jgi:hypothetical protein
VHPPPSPARANFTLMTECTPESSGYNSVYSVEVTVNSKEENSYDFVPIMSKNSASVRVLFSMEHTFRSQ